MSNRQREAGVVGPEVRYASLPIEVGNILTTADAILEEHGVSDHGVTTEYVGDMGFEKLLGVTRDSLVSALRDANKLGIIQDSRKGRSAPTFGKEDLLAFVVLVFQVAQHSPEGKRRGLKQIPPMGDLWGQVVDETRKLLGNDTLSLHIHTIASAQEEPRPLTVAPVVRHSETNGYDFSSIPNNKLQESLAATLKAILHKSNPIAVRDVDKLRLNEILGISQKDMVTILNASRRFGIIKDTSALSPASIAVFAISKESLLGFVAVLWHAVQDAQDMTSTGLRRVNLVSEDDFRNVVAKTRETLGDNPISLSIHNVSPVALDGRGRIKKAKDGVRTDFNHDWGNVPTGENIGKDSLGRMANGNTVVFDRSKNRH